MERLVFLFRISLAAFVAVLLLYVLLYPLKARAQVPPGAEPWKREITRQTRLEWGLDAPIATFAAQIEQESAFRADARSAAGAMGIAQFMPATAKWLAGAYSALGPADPLNPTWAIRALARYDLHLFARVRAANDCEQMAFALSAYNGGEKYRDRGIALCSNDDEELCDPSRWFGNVELVDDGRSLAAWKENRGYPTRILLVREPSYLKAGWGRGMCE